ncbi:tail fiber assembly protein [Pseudomonas monsensis]
MRNARTNRLDKANTTLATSALVQKVELGLATPAEKAALLEYKQFFIDLSNVNKQPGYPLTVNWP